MNTPQDSSLGHEVAYPSQYDAGLLFPIPRAAGRAEIGIADGAPGSSPGQALPFIGHDRWHAYEIGWLDARGKPRVATATFTVPCASPNLVESKSLKLYLNSLNAERFNSEEAVRERIAVDLSARAGADVAVAFGLPPMAEARSGQASSGESIDLLDIDIDDYGPPNPDHLSADPAQVVEESLTSQLLKSNCPVTGQPDWASVVILYRGPRLDRAGLLRYLVSFRDHAGFHEQCVERMFHDLMARCRPQALSVEARYTRRGGLDINPWRATEGFPPPTPAREPRQ
ncbi:NADPH-dependent 7-cyano-7-deazaguanine reductase QueF [Pseudoxanthomonas yeongjuensis]|uniref:NADPH-dependent 7-cyano-7-deazaguanine reductase QueF n=1 Tax=Pseudoxanthomonas yeongjuensis TaxID=377616 RepID=UPI001390B756|nr:NADPH-dependent 7-cyano-7-deazaguanine reductase QueF [Pseudoxanthomonas yeongjuensis]KAF1715637.1 NADPH-dependent 7-cyano-7-deazaguanine reductase QueF [Pseudoxanthomonas yeongjuensis]